MIASREICKICYHVNAVGFTVSSGMWEAAIPEKHHGDVVCLSCFTRLADEKLILWCEAITLFPVSLAAHLDFAK